MISLHNLVASNWLFELRITETNSSTLVEIEDDFVLVYGVLYVKTSEE
jgi:hypothetical protein